ncbi:MAG: hypothetical protein JO248_20920 [Acidimicrobiia bacterium]|nr:hypothetical protein [Acidimicrobiia bacterium]
MRPRRGAPDLATRRPAQPVRPEISRIPVVGLMVVQARRQRARLLRDR